MSDGSYVIYNDCHIVSIVALKQIFFMPKPKKVECVPRVVLVELDQDQLREANEEALASGKSLSGVVRKTTKELLKRLRNNPLWATLIVFSLLLPALYDYIQ